MQKKYQYFPGGGFHTLNELEALLQFKFLPQIAFETPEAQQDVLTRGLEKLNNSGISEETLMLGQKYKREIEAAYIPDVSVRFLDPKVGTGLFAEEEIETGSYVGEYTGIVRKNDRRYMEPLNDYCYEYPVPDYIGRSFVIDATQGHLTRFINHSYNPNLKPVHVFYEGYYHLIFIALERIKKGAQLSYNYGKNYWYIRRPPLEL